MKPGTFIAAARRVRDLRTLANIVALQCLAHPGRNYCDSPSWRELDAVVTEVESVLTQAEAEARAEQGRKDREIERLEASVARFLSGVQASSVEDALLSPHGYFVYTLIDSEGQALYVGLSTNILSRLGQHMSNPARRSLVASISLLRCTSEEAMRSTEARLIGELRPPLNINLVPAAST